MEQIEAFIELWWFVRAIQGDCHVIEGENSWANLYGWQSNRLFFEEVHQVGCHGGQTDTAATVGGNSGRPGRRRAQFAGSGRAGWWDVVAPRATPAMVVALRAIACVLSASRKYRRHAE